MKLRRLGAHHRYVPLLMTVPGIGWVLAYTIAAEIGDIGRFGSATKLSGYTGLCLSRHTTPPMSFQLERGDTPGRQLVLELAAPTSLAHVAEVRGPHPRS